MENSDEGSFHAEIKTIVTALADISRSVERLREFHNAELSTSTGLLTARNRQLSDSCKTLRAELGKLSPALPHPPILPHATMQDSSDLTPETILQQVPPTENGFPNANLRSGALANGEEEQILTVPFASSVQPLPSSPQNPEQSSPRDRAQFSLNDEIDEPVAGHVTDISGFRLSEINQESDEVLSLLSAREAAAKMAVPSEGLALRSAWAAVPSRVIDTCMARYIFKTVDYRKTLRRSTQSWDSLRELMGYGQSVQRWRFNSLSIAHPGGPFRICWNGMSLAFISYDVFVVPMQAFDIGDEDGFRIVEWIAALFWTVDMGLWFRTGYYEGSKLEMRPRKIAVKYAKTWLVFDLLIVGLEWVSRLASVVLSASVLRASRIVRRMVRFVKLIRVWKLQGIWRGLHEHVNSSVVQLCSTVTILCIALLITIHVISCLWYALGKGQRDGWPSHDEYNGHKNTFFWYVASTRWAISQFNGRTDMNETRTMSERLFTCIVGILLGVFARAMMLGFITRLLLELSELVSEKARRNRHVNEFLESHPVPAVLTSNIKRYAREYSNASSRRDAEDTVLAILPERVQAELLFEVRLPVLDMHPYFRSLVSESRPSSLIACKKVRSIHAVKLDAIFTQGDPCTRMIFIDKVPMTYYPLYNAQASVDLTAPEGWSSEFSCELSPSSPGSNRRRKSRTDRKQAFAAFGRSTTADTLDSNAIAREMKENEWISEAALWVEWFNRGRLVPQEHGQLYAIEASDLAESVKHHRDAYSMTAAYARVFMAELQTQELLSDLASFHINFHEQTPYRLEVVVVSAEGLPNVDGFLRGGASDPYVVCYVTGKAGSHMTKIFKTKVIDDCLDPVWNHHEFLQVSERQSLHFKVFDSELVVSNDRLLGEARLEAMNFLTDGFEGELPLFGGVSPSGCAFLTVRVTVVDIDKKMLSTTFSDC